MGLQTIPADWCRAVSTAIKRDRVRFTADAHREWQRSFPGCWRYDLDQALLNYLARDARGCHITMASPPGETWEFIFQLLGCPAYGKILLRTDHVSVVVFSAHRPEKSKLSCE